MIWELRCWRTLRAQKRARELKPPFCFLNYFTLIIHRWRGAYVLIATLARWTHVGASRSDMLIMRLRSHLCHLPSPYRTQTMPEDGQVKRFLFTRGCYDAVLSVVSVVREGFLQVWTTMLLDYSTLQNSTPFTGCSKKLLKIKGRANLLAFYLLEHPWHWHVLQLHFKMAPLVVAPKLTVELASSSYRRFSPEASRSSVAISSCTTSNTYEGSAIVLTEQQH